VNEVLSTYGVQGLGFRVQGLEFRVLKFVWQDGTEEAEL